MILTKMGIIRRICSYCDKQYGTKDSGTDRDGDSHGICPDCNNLSDAEMEVIVKRKAAARAKLRTFKQFTVG